MNGRSVRAGDLYNFCFHVAFCRVIPNLYFASDHAANDPVTAKAYDCTSTNLDIVCDDTAWRAASTFNNTVKPFDDIQLGGSHHSLLDASLSRVITKVIQTLVQSTCRFTMVSSLIHFVAAAFSSLLLKDARLCL